MSARQLRNDAPGGTRGGASGQPPPRLLVVEDDETLRDVLEVALAEQGHEVMAVQTGVGVADVVTRFRPDLAIIDIQPGPGPDGLAVARVLHDEAGIPFLFLAAADSEADRLAAFSSGADDYLVKPFSMPELLARIRVILRRSGHSVSTRLEVCDLVLDDASHTVTRAGTVLELTPKEYDLLFTLMTHRGRVRSKNQLLSQVWGFDYDDNVVEVAMSGLRKKLEEHGPRVVQTVRGAGYKLQHG